MQERNSNNFLKDQPTFEYRHLQKALNPNLLLRKPLAHEVNGDVRIGYVMNTNRIFGLLLAEINQHTLIFGRSGSGKTNLNRCIQSELQRIGVPFLVFDLTKYGTRYIKKYLPETKIVRWNKELFLNILSPPPRVSEMEWLMSFCEIFSESFGLFAASKSALIEVVKEAYLPIQSKEPGEKPTLKDIHRLLSEKRKKASRVDADYIDRIRNKTTAILTTLERQLDVNEGLSIEKLLNHNVCIELVGINSIEIQSWLVNTLMAWISSYRTANMHYGKLRHVIFYDEAAHTFRRDKETFLIGCTRRFREAGEGLILSDQSITSLNDVMKSNIYTLICLSQSGTRDIKEASELLGVVPPPMEPGQGIIRLAGRYPQPVLLSFPYVEPQYITENELDEMNSEDVFLQALIRDVKKRKESEINTAKPELEKVRVNDDAIRLLWAVYKGKYQKTITEIYKDAELGVGGSGKRAAEYCERHNLIQIIKPCFGKSKYPILLPNGYELLGIQDNSNYGKGCGAEHKLYQALIAEHFSEFNPKVEMNRNDKFIDIGIGIKDGRGLLAIEVEMSADTIKNNIEKDFNKAKCDFLIIACLDEKILKEGKNVLSHFQDSIKDKTRVMLIKDIFKIGSLDIF